jgi:hypothetical protein
MPESGCKRSRTAFAHTRWPLSWTLVSREDWSAPFVVPDPMRRTLRFPDPFRLSLQGTL